MTSVSMDLKQICLRLQLYFPFERKKSDVPQFFISMVAVPSRASQTKRLNSTSTDDNFSATISTDAVHTPEYPDLLGSRLPHGRQTVFKIEI